MSQAADHFVQVAESDCRRTTGRAVFIRAKMKSIHSSATEPFLNCTLDAVKRSAAARYLATSETFVRISPGRVSFPA